MRVPSQHKTDCAYFSWKWVNYSESFNVSRYWNAGNHDYIAWCSRDDISDDGFSVRAQFRRPVRYPCDGCPYYEQGEESGQDPPTGAPGE